MTLTAHCLIKNEENFIWFALKSVLDFVDEVIVFDTGSTDSTVAIVRNLQKEYSNIIFEEKGECNMEEHTRLRQEMVERTKTDWFMILDGDEVWTSRALGEARKEIESKKYDCLISPFYLCVGDVYHYSNKGQYTLRGIKIHATPRFFKKQENMRWEGKYNFDAMNNAEGKKIFEGDRVLFLKERFWHLTHLLRSSKDGDDYSSGSSRAKKRRLTYFLIGSIIDELAPEVFDLRNDLAVRRMSYSASLLNFFDLIFKKLFYVTK